MSVKWIDPRPDEFGVKWRSGMEEGALGHNRSIYNGPSNGNGRDGVNFKAVKGSQGRSRKRRVERIKAALGKTPKPRHTGGFA